MPGIKASMDAAHKEALGVSKLRKKADESDTVYTIQVVFHVVYNNNLENVSDELIMSQLKVLNEAFRRTHPDTNDTREIFKPVAADTKIQFKLATEDPDSNPTSGINRVPTSRTSFLRTTFSLTKLMT